MNPKNQSADIFPLFDTFWNNAGLRGTVFPIKIPTDTPQQFEQKSKAIFKEMVDTFDPKIYSFIQIN